MPSRILPTDDLEQRATAYWLPPGGQDNGVSATMWVGIAELETRDTPVILALLADADIGAYAGCPGSYMTRGNVGSRLYVDGMQYNQALDVLMGFLRGRETQDLAGYVPAKRPVQSTPTRAQVVRRRRSAARLALRVVQGVLAAAAVTLLLAAAYQSFVERNGGPHPGGHHGQEQPGIHQSPPSPSVP